MKFIFQTPKVFDQALETPVWSPEPFLPTKCLGIQKGHFDQTEPILISAFSWIDYEKICFKSKLPVPKFGIQTRLLQNANSDKALSSGGREAETF